MNFQNLQYFLVVAEELNITRAAERLHISEQALSHHVNKLEKELGTRLFHRTPRLSLTLGGKRLQQASREIGEIRRQLQVELDDINNSATGELRIGVSYTRGQAVLPLLLPPFYKNHPRITISLLEGRFSELQTSLGKGMLDLLIDYAPIRLDSAEVVEIGRERLFFVVPKHFMDSLYGGEAEAKRREFASGADIGEFKELPFILLAKDDRIRRLTDRLCTQSGVRPHILLETRNIQTAFALSMQGLGITVYPELFLTSRSILPGLPQDARSRPVDFFPIKSELTTQTIVIARDKECYLSNAARDFIQQAQTALDTGMH